MKGSGEQSAAFRQLVEEHLDLVHSVARRVTGNAEAARDVAQIVFLKLHRKHSSIPADLPLTAWLHRETHSASVNHVRAEVRRKSRERVAADLSAMNQESELWHDLAPEIDAAINRLPTKDRSVVLLRFYENRSYAAIGERLGFSEDATRMRTNRALGKLRGILRARGIQATATLLASTLPGHAVQKAPESLALAILKTPLVGSSLLTSLVLMTKTHFLALATIALVLPIVVYQQNRVSNLAEENKELRFNLQSSPPRAAMTAPERTPRVVSTREPQKGQTAKKTPEVITPESALAQIMARIGEGLASRHPSMVQAINRLEGIPPATLLAICHKTEDLKQKKELAGFLADYLGASAPQACMDFVASLPTDWQAALAAKVIQKWSSASPEKAAAWFLEHEMEESALLGTGAQRDRVAVDLSRVIMQKGSLGEALGFAEKLLDRSRQEAVVSGIVAWAKPETAIELGEQIFARDQEAPVDQIAMTEIAERLSRDDLQKGREWIETIPEDREALAQAAYEGHALTWIKTEAQEAADWWIQKNGQANPAKIYQKITEAWVDTAPNQCGEWLLQQPQNESLDNARAAYARAIAERHPDAASTWANSVEDANLRAVLQRELNENP